MLDKFAHFIKEIFDALNSKGGGIAIALLVFFASFFMWLATKEPQLLNITIFAAGGLAGLGGGDRLANGRNKSDKEV